MNKYASIIKQVFETEAEANGVNRELMFTYEDLERAMEETGVEVFCLPGLH
jgi:hypothetical protein